LAWGYYDRPDLTAERFMPSPFGAGERLYRTGDLARWSRVGEIDFLGRIDAQVKIRGFRIEPGEVETVLLTHPAVEKAAILARRDLGDDTRLVAYVVARVGEEPASESALRAYLKERLPAYMVPAGFVFLATLPLTANGKVDRRALPAPEWGGGTTDPLVPRTPAEEVLAAIWSEVLGLDRVGTHDDFFSLGGHSLLATRVISRVRQAFGVDLPLRRLFEASTIAGLAAAIAGELPAAIRVPPLLPAARPREIPLSFAQERLWFLDQLVPGSAVYNIPLPARLSGTLAPAVLAAVLGEVVRRHEVLRTIFLVTAGRPVQVVVPP